MTSNVVDDKTKPIKYQVYLTKDLQEGLTRFISDQFSAEDRVVTATIRKAVAEFLEKRGYYGAKDHQANS